MEYDIVLIVPPSRAFARYRPPIAYLHLGGYLIKYGYRVLLIEERVKHFIKYPEKLLLANKLIQKLSTIKTRVIGISSFTYEFPLVKYLAQGLKNQLIKQGSQTLIVAGGIHPTLFPEEFIYEKSPFDIIIRGEGEIPLRQICDFSRKKIDISEISNACYLKKGQLCFSDSLTFSNNLDEITYPDFNLLDMKYYTTPNANTFRGIYLSAFHFLIGRGCPSACRFCVNKNIKNYSGSKIRTRSPESVCNDLEYLKKNFKIDAFYVIDDACTGDKNYVHRLCDELICRKINLLWAGQSRINNIDYEMLKHLRESGCIQLDFGVESGSDKMLRLMKKGITTGQIIRVFDDCHRVGIRPFANILFNFPGEDQEDIEQTVKLIDRIRPSTAYFNIFFPVPGCDIYHEKNISLSDAEMIALDDDANLLRENEQKYRYAAHNYDITELVRKFHFKYNKLKTLLKFMLSPVYFFKLIKSKRKLSYLWAFFPLLGEYIRHMILFLTKDKKNA